MGKKCGIVNIIPFGAACMRAHTHAFGYEFMSCIAKLVGQRRKSTDFHESLHLCSARYWHKFMIWLHNNKWNGQNRFKWHTFHNWNSWNKAQKKWQTHTHRKKQKYWKWTQIVHRMRKDAIQCLNDEEMNLKMKSYTAHICLFQIDKLILYTCVRLQLDLIFTFEKNNPDVDPHTRPIHVAAIQLTLSNTFELNL